MAWLHARPGKRKESRAKILEARRTEKYDPPELQLPEIDPCEHLVDYLFEAGPMVGEHALTWQELDRWAARTGVDPSEFEASAIITLSRVYVAMLFDARDEHCPPPFAIEKTAEQKADVSKRFREMLHQAAAGVAKKPKSQKGKSKNVDS